MQSEASPLESADIHVRAKSDDLARTCISALLPELLPEWAIVPGITRNQTAAAERRFSDDESSDDKNDTTA